MTKSTSRARAVSAAKLARQRAAERRRKARFGSVVAAVVLVASMLVGFVVYQTRDKAPDNFAVPKGATATGVVVGKPDAKVTIDLYVDFMCPHCKRFEEESAATLDKLVADGTVKIAYHPLAILDGYSSTEYSTRAASAAGSAAEAGVFDKFARALFANQPAEGGPGLSDAKLIELGKAAGATSPEFERGVNDEKYADWVTALTETASKQGVTSTPTVLVDGEQVSDPTVEAVQAAVRKAAEK